MRRCFELEITARREDAARQCLALLEQTNFCLNCNVRQMLDSCGGIGYDIGGLLETERQVEDLNQNLQAIDVKTIESIRASAFTCMKVYAESDYEVGEKIKVECSRLGLDIFVFSSDRLEEVIRPVSRDG